MVYTPTETLFGPEIGKDDNATKEIAKAFQKRLLGKAGFKYVPEPVPMKNSKNAVIYYLFFASPNKTANKIVTEILDKYRREGVL